MDLKQLINLPVYTQSGHYLGRVVDLEIDSETGRVVKYFVKSQSFIKNLFQGCLIISESQVLSISKEKMVVEDNLKKVKGLASSPVR